MLAPKPTRTKVDVSVGEKAQKKVSIISCSHPEMDRLATALSMRENLASYVRRYAYQGRLWERSLKKLPIIGPKFSQNCDRRKLPLSLAADCVIEAGVISDFLLAHFQRSTLTPLNRAMGDICQAARNRSISRTGTRSLKQVECLVANYGVARKGFQRARELGIRTVLNYPNAHHRFSKRLLAEEALLEPEFADTITWETEKQGPTYDEECSLADTIMVGSGFAKRTFMAEGFAEKDIRVTPYGCSFQEFFPRQDNVTSNVFRTVFAGLLTQRKGLSYLFKAYNLFAGKHTELLIAGRFVRKSEALARQLSMVSYRGSLTQPEVAEMFRNADVFVFPTLLEGMGLVVLEAMASGIPVITTENGPSDLVRNGIEGFVIPIRDPEAICEKLELLRANPDLKREMGQAARRRALEFSWEAYSNLAASIVLE